MAINLTSDNYYSAAANKDYMSVSQFKDFAGTQAHGSCEDVALRKYNGLIPQPRSTALLVGSYIDSYFEGTLDNFKAENPDIFKKTGDKGLKADYVTANDIIHRIEHDALFMNYMSGQKQVIMTANLFGTDWKIKMDSYHPGDKIVDLKIMKDMQPIWSDLLCRKIDFIRYWGYDIQGAVYQKVVELNTGKKLPFYIACATKETPADIEIIEITQPYLDKALSFVEEKLSHVLDIKSGKVAPEKCGKCYYCKNEKTLRSPITIESIIPAYETDNEDSDTGADMHVQGFALFD